MLNYNRALSDEKSYQDLQIKEIQPIMKLIVRGKKRDFFKYSTNLDQLIN